MAILRLTGFTGTADILGIVREVRFDAGGLLIGGLGLEDAHAVVSALSTGSLMGVDPFDPTKPASHGSKTPEARPGSRLPFDANNLGAEWTKDPAEIVEESAIGQDKKNPPAARATAATAPAPVPVEEKTKEHSSAPVAPIEEKTKEHSSAPVAPIEQPLSAQEAPRPAPAEETVTEPDLPGPKTDPSGPPSIGLLGLPPAVRNAKRFAVVVDYFLAQGVKDPAEIVKACEAARDEVPLIQRIPNLADRVRTALIAAE